MHQGSALSPLSFMIVMEAISREFRVAPPWELLYADDLAVIAETEEELIKRLNEWNSLQCTSCQKWVHKKCSGTKNSMSKVAVIHL